MIELSILKGPIQRGETKELKYGDEISIGRDSSNDWILKSTGISKKHCKLVVLPGDRVEVEDLGSANGTFINGLLVKKHVAKPGDVVQLHNFHFQITRVAPKLSMNAMALSNNGDVLNPPADGGSMPGFSIEEGSKVEVFLSKNIFPLADNLSSQFSLRPLMFFVFIIWASLIVLLTATPVFDQANQRIKEKASEVASLYARQLVRVNQQAIIDQRYRDLISTLDSRAGQTLGVLDSKIIDAKKGEVLAPLNELGQGLSTPESVKAISSGYAMVQYRGDLIFATSPIKVGTAEGINDTVAVAYVVYDGKHGQFKIFDLTEQWLISLFGAVLLSLLFLVFLYRWIEGTLAEVSSKIDEGLKKGDLQISTKMKWPVLQNLIDNVGAVWGRSNSSADSAGGGPDWAIGVANATRFASAALSTELQVLAWNPAMEKVIGIRATTALGADISAASRDVSFESNVREMCAQAGLNPWVYFSKDIEFSGRFHEVRVVGGSSAFLIQVTLKEGE